MGIKEFGYECQFVEADKGTYTEGWTVSDASPSDTSAYWQYNHTHKGTYLPCFTKVVMLIYKQITERIGR